MRAFYFLAPDECPGAATAGRATTHLAVVAEEGREIFLRDLLSGLDPRLPAQSPDARHVDGFGDAIVILRGHLRRVRARFSAAAAAIPAAAAAITAVTLLLGGHPVALLGHPVALLGHSIALHRVRLVVL